MKRLQHLFGFLFQHRSLTIFVHIANHSFQCFPLIHYSTYPCRCCQKDQGYPLVLSQFQTGNTRTLHDRKKINSTQAKPRNWKRCARCDDFQTKAHDIMRKTARLSYKTTPAKGSFLVPCRRLEIHRGNVRLKLESLGLSLAELTQR